MAQTADQLRVIFLPGMQGDTPGDRWFVKGLIEGGATDSRLFDWTESWWAMKNLHDRDGHRRAAEKLAGKLQQLSEEDPHKTTILIGHSTGAMVILDILPLLQADLIDQAWLLNAAVSRGYDLTAALPGARRIVNLYSKNDWVVLNLGTKLFGTADGSHEASAGHEPFDGPGSGDARLEQLPYDPAWAKTGHLGLHTTFVFKHFSRDVLLPMILERT